MQGEVEGDSANSVTEPGGASWPLARRGSSERALRRSSFRPEFHSSTKHSQELLSRNAG